mgnify:CR=1 FL=1
MVTKLTIANGALRHIGEEQLTQTELTNASRKPARVFNAIWDDGGVRACLEEGQWRFAKRTVSLTYSPSVSTEDWDFDYAFDKPTDWVRTLGVWGDSSMGDPLRDYREEAGYWYANVDTLYVSFVSDDASFGGDYSLWPQSFVRFVEAHFGAEMAGPMTDAGKELRGLRGRLLAEARSKDSIRDPSRQLPVGSWVRARRGGSSRENG